MEREVIGRKLLEGILVENKKQTNLDKDLWVQDRVLIIDRIMVGWSKRDSHICINLTGHKLCKFVI